jgi:hypothetical protein
MKAPEPPTLYKRRYTETDKISSKDLYKSYRTAARMVDKYGEKYLPLFERLHTEIEDLKRTEELKARATEIARRSRRSKPPSL